jgi:hypothetical protein
MKLNTKPERSESREFTVVSEFTNCSERGCPSRSTKTSRDALIILKTDLARPALRLGRPRSEKFVNSDTTDWLGRLTAQMNFGKLANISLETF